MHDSHQGLTHTWLLHRSEYLLGWTSSNQRRNITSARRTTSLFHLTTDNPETKEFTHELATTSISITTTLDCNNQKTTQQLPETTQAS
jgi:hypothetical protein